MDATIEQEAEYIDVLYVIANHFRKQLVDEWVEQSLNWIEGVARHAAYRLRRGRRNLTDDSWQDLRSEMLIQAYEAVNRWDAQRTPLDVFLRGTLFKFAMRNDVVKRNELMERGEIDADRLPSREKEEISSLERAHGVFDLLEGLMEHEKTIINLHYCAGWQLQVIDRLIGASHSTTFHRLQQILERIREKRETHAFT